MCYTLPGPPGVLSFHVSLNGQQFIAEELSFERYAPPTAWTISPASGPVAGQTSVRVVGNGSLRTVSNSAPRCRFRTSVVIGNLDGVGTMRCLAPTSVQSGPLSISLNAQQYSSPGLPYEAYDVPRAVEAAPSLGPASGGTLVVVSVDNLTGTGTDIRCRFRCLATSAEHAVGAVISAPGAIACTTPSLETGNHTLRVTLNGQQFSDSVPYDVAPVPRAVSVFPLSGPSAGGTVVTVSSEALLAAGDPNLLRCKFGNTSVLASWLSSDSVACRSPEGESAGAYARLQMNFAAPQTGTEFARWQLPPES